MICVVSVPIIGLGLTRIDTAVEDVYQWLPDVSQAREDYNEFKDTFGSDDFLVVTWKGARIGDPRLAAYAEAVVAMDTGGLVLHAFDGPTLCKNIAFETTESQRKVAERLQGVFFGKDLADTCVLVNFTEEGMSCRTEAMKLVRQAPNRVDGLMASDLVIAGYPYVGAHADSLVQHTFASLLLPACLVSSLVAFYYLRHVVALIAILSASGLAAGLGIAAITLSGSKWGALSSIIPTLSYILSLSGGMHLIRYAANLPKGWTVSDLLSVAWKPCATSAITTIIGMLSLGVSSYPAVRQFGVFCAIGVAASLLFQLLVLPSLLRRFAGSATIRARRMTPVWARMLYTVRVRYAEVLALSTIVGVVSIVGLTLLKTDSQAENLFHHSSPVLTQMREVESRLGPLDQTELLVSFTDPDPDSFYRRADFVRQLEERLTERSEISKAFSFADYLPKAPTGGGWRNTSRRVAIRRAVNGVPGKLDEYPGADLLLHFADNKETWRISLRVPLVGETDYGALEVAALETSRRVEEQFFEDAENRALPRPAMIYTGSSHLFHEAQDSLLADLGRNFGLAFVVITPVMIFCLGSLRLGLMAMVPNVTPALIVFGMDGVLGVRIDIAIAMTACVALGIAVDDTAHFLIRFRDLGGSLRTPLPALERAYSQCGPAMLQTTMISGIGMFVFSFSSLAAMGRFAYTLVFLLFFAIVGNLILLPPMIAPLRRLVRKRTSRPMRRAA